jgi:hypothetical protein
MKSGGQLGQQGRYIFPKNQVCLAIHVRRCQVHDDEPGTCLPGQLGQIANWGHFQG